MVKLRLYWWLLVVALLTVLLGLRLWQLSSIPAVLNPDEASIAYNAYLLGETGRDEWGRSWPLVLEAFGDQKVVGYTLLVVPLVKLFGMVDWVGRLPAALASVAVAGVVAWLVYRWRKNPWLALMVLLLLGIQPIFIWYGRMAFEAVVALLYCLGILIAGLYSWRKPLLQWLVVGGLVIAACFTYNTPLILIPLLGLVLPFWHGWQKWRMWLPVGVVMALVWLGCMFVSQNLATQKSQITIFGDETLKIEYGAYRQQFPGILQKAFGNKYVYYAREAGERYFASWSPLFMVDNAAGHPWHSLPRTGYVTWSAYFLGWIGWLLFVYQAWRHRLSLGKVRYELLWMYLAAIALVPASLTVNAPHATRSLLFFISWGVAAGYAGWWLMTKWRWLVLPVVALVVLPSLMYLYQLFVTYPQSAELQAPLQPGLPQILKQHNYYDTEDEVAIVDPRGFAYISVAWYAQMSPEEFSRTIIKQQPDKINFKFGERVGHFHFIGDVDDPTSARHIVYWDHQQLQWLVKP